MQTGQLYGIDLEDMGDLRKVLHHARISKFSGMFVAAINSGEDKIKLRRIVNNILKACGDGAPPNERLNVEDFPPALWEQVQHALNYRLK